MYESLEEKPSKPHPTAWREMHRWLEARSVQDLRQLAETRGMPRHARRKSELVSALVSLLALPENVSQTLQTLAPGERAVLELIYLLAPDQRLSSGEIRRALLAWYGPVFAQSTDAYLTHLTSQAMLFSLQGDASDCVQLPQAVLACLGSLTRPLDQVDVATSEGASFVEFPPDALPQAVMALWKYIGEHDVPAQSAKRKQSGQSRSASENRNIKDWLDAVSAAPDDGAEQLYEELPLDMCHLSEPDMAAVMADTGYSEDLLAFAYELMLELGLAAKIGNRIQVNELAMERYRRQSETRQLQSLLSAWLSLAGLSDVARVLQSRPELGLYRRIHATDSQMEDLSRDISQLRGFLARLLGLLAPGKWFEMASFLEAVRELWPALFLAARKASTSPPWRLASAPPTIGDPQPDVWHSTYGVLLASMISGPLVWLGGIKLAHVDQTSAFQLNSLGRYLLGHYPQLNANDGDMRPLAVNDDLDVRVQLGRVDADAHDFLGLFAELVEAESDVFRYHITPQQLNIAFESGLTLGEILGFLERVSGAAVPLTARRLLTRWHENYGNVRLYQDLTVIEFADDFALKELMNTTSLANTIIHEISPRLVVIDPHSVETLVAEMQRKGYTPKLKGALS